jgi:hypothetical protein
MICYFASWQLTFEFALFTQTWGRESPPSLSFLFTLCGVLCLMKFAKVSLTILDINVNSCTFCVEDRATCNLVAFEYDAHLGGLPKHELQPLIFSL